jgi:hypothetical protein
MAVCFTLVLATLPRQNRKSGAIGGAISWQVQRSKIACRDGNLQRQSPHRPAIPEATGVIGPTVRGITGASGWQEAASHEIAGGFHVRREWPLSGYVVANWRRWIMDKCAEEVSP